jgi:hypothetical protein
MGGVARAGSHVMKIDPKIESSRRQTHKATEEFSTDVSTSRKRGFAAQHTKSQRVLA